jgi:hypothetical protein
MAIGLYEFWRDGRAVEGTGLENRQTCKRLQGSNPCPSATPNAHNKLSLLVLSLSPLITIWKKFDVL